MTDAILQIGRGSSSCSECNRGADPHEDSHVTALGYFRSEILDNPDHPARKGCGARFVAVTSMNFGDGMVEGVKAMRPDLPYSERYWLAGQDGQIKFPPR